MAARTGILLIGLGLLAGCDQLGIPTPAATAAKRDADAKAIGAGCRHAGRAIEDCYVLNKKADKAAVFAGWREMEEYMRENKLETVAPVVPIESAKPASAPAAAAVAPEDDEAEDEAPASSDKAKPRATAAH